MMGIIVSKFGGTSMADAECFLRVSRIIGARTQQQYIVLSAPGKRYAGDDKVTDLLCRAHANLVSGRDEVSELNAVSARFSEIIRSLLPELDPEVFLSSLQASVMRSPDSAAAQGEYLCAMLFSHCFRFPFIDAASLIHFDSCGRLLLDKTRISIRQMAARFPSAVIPGFYGSLPDGEIKTFARGGSDITGALVAAALNADIYENWTDVCGVMSADPSLCSDTICHPTISYRQMQALALSGAQVLHPSCLDPVREAGIPTVLRNTFAPESAGTYISDRVHSVVPCVCVKNGLFSLAIDRLSNETREIALGLAEQIYRSADGRHFLLLNSKSRQTEPVSIISVFGLPTELREQAEHISGSIASFCDNECLRFQVPADKSEISARALHDLLIRQYAENTRTL